MTFLEAKAKLRGYGLTLSRREGEYRVNLLNASEDSAYYTTHLFGML